jgi:molybdenum cofactor synthesis domain-containing protein
MVAKIKALCLSQRKGERKTAVAAADFVAASGLAGDAHAGQWHRQVSLLAAEDVAAFEQEAGLSALGPGAFAENVVVSGLDLARVGLGSRLRLGAAVEVSVTQIGKTCHAPCAIQKLSGGCLMPVRGVFARVLKGGRAAIGDEVEILELVPRELLQAVVLTISDRCSKGQARDTAGPAVADLVVRRLGAHVYAAEVLPDEREAIAERLKHYADGHSIDLLVAVGGTGFAPRDVTPEAVLDVVQRRTPGLDEAMRAASLAVTPQAMLSRAASGICGQTLIVSLPGSERGATENLEAILPALPHGLAKMRGDLSDCGRPATKGET